MLTFLWEFLVCSSRLSSETNDDQQSPGYLFLNLVLPELLPTIIWTSTRQSPFLQMLQAGLMPGYVLQLDIISIRTIISVCQPKKIDFTFSFSCVILFTPTDCFYTWAFFLLEYKSIRNTPVISQYLKKKLKYVVKHIVHIRSFTCSVLKKLLYQIYMCEEQHRNVPQNSEFGQNSSFSFFA